MAALWMKPIGIALSVLAILWVLAAQGVLGATGLDRYAGARPLARYLSDYAGYSTLMGVGNCGVGRKIIPVNPIE
jgi:hypothetical protein